MTTFVAWVVAPLAWTMMSAGLGLLVRALMGDRLPGLLTIPVGYAGFVVVSTLTTAWSATAVLTMPLVVVLSILGGYLGRAELTRWRDARGPSIAAAVVYGLYALPMLVSGSPFAGWIKLDDGSTWLAFSDRLADAGRTTEGLAPSSYEAAIQINWDGLTWGGPYPVGVFPPLGGMAKLLNFDAAWLLQPYLVFLAGVLAVGVYTMLRPFVDQIWLLVSLTVLASTPALLLGYSLWGGIKEMSLTPLFLVATILAVRRYSFALAVVTAACMVIAGFSGGTWLAVPLLYWLIVTIARRDWISLLMLIGATLVMSIPLLVKLTPAGVTSLLQFASASKDIGNLPGPLDRLQVLGIWPAGDFREAPAAMAPVLVLLVAVILLAAIGVWRAGVTRVWEMPLYLGNVVLIAIVFSFGNAWIGGKALAMASPAPLVAAAAGIGWLWSQRQVIEAGIGLALVAIGVAWSYALAYHDVWLAPTAQLEELRAIGADDSLQAPALMLEYSPYGVRHFLRELDAEGAGELRRRTIPTVDGGTVDKAAYADIDEISQIGLADFPTLVLRRSPIASRPPSNYTLAWSGQFYDVWERDPDAAEVLSHTPFGDAADPAWTPQCSGIEDIAATAGPQDRLAFVERPPLVIVPLGPEGAIVPTGSTQVTESFEVAETGEYQLALGGSFTGQVTVGIDGQQVWQGRHQLNWTGNTTPMGAVPLTAGVHELTLDYEASAWQPGSGGAAWPLGPVYLSLDEQAVNSVAVADARSLCRKRLDWLEVVR